MEEKLYVTYEKILALRLILLMINKTPKGFNYNKIKPKDIYDEERGKVGSQETQSVL